MSIVSVRTIDLFEILQDNQFSIGDDSIMKSIKLIEKELKLELIYPVDEKIKEMVKSDLETLKTKWLKLNEGDDSRKSFRALIRNEKHNFIIDNSQIVQNCPSDKKNETTKQDILNATNEKINKELRLNITKISNEQILNLKRKLSDTTATTTTTTTTSTTTNNIIQSDTCKRDDAKLAKTDTTSLKISQIFQAESAANRKSSRKTIRSILQESVSSLTTSASSISSSISSISSSSSNCSSSSSSSSIVEQYQDNIEIKTNNKKESDQQQQQQQKIPKMKKNIEKMSLESDLISESISSSVSMPKLKKSNIISSLIMSKRIVQTIKTQQEKVFLSKLKSSSSSDNLCPLTSKIIKYGKRKSYYDVTERQRHRLKKQIKTSLLESTQFLRNMGLCLGSIEINPIELDECDFKLKIRPPTNVSNPEKNKPTVNTLLYYKDKYSISDKAYSDLKTKCFLDMPTIFHLKKRRASLDDMFEIHDNEMGVFISMQDKLKFRIGEFFDSKYGFGDLNDTSKFKDSIIHIKLGADGTNIGRNLKLLNFTFTIINEGPKAKKATGNYTIGIFEIENENYRALTDCFKELIDEIGQLKQLSVRNVTVQLVYYLSGDWKMLGNALGIQGANSKYPCIWCKCCKDNFYDLDSEWSIIDARSGARSHQEIQDILQNTSNEKKQIKYGHEKEPIFRDIIPISRYMIDMLHLFLRISDTLFNLLIKDCSLLDNFDMAAISKFDVSIYKHLNSLQHFLNERCNVRFTFLWIAETKKLTWRDLVGPEKIRFFENFNLAEIIPDHESFDSVSKIWLDFFSLVQDVKSVRIESSVLKTRTSEWLKLYLSVYNKVTVTPYMHAFVSHLHEFVYLYKDINAFNCQGLEKLNDLSTGQYFKGTNKRDSALHQMLKKRNRMEYLSSFILENDD